MSSTILTYAAQADSGASSAFDASAVTAPLRLTATLLADLSECKQLDLYIEQSFDGSSGWQTLQHATYRPSQPAQNATAWPATNSPRFILGAYEKFIRIRWVATKGVGATNLHLGLVTD